MGRYEAALWTRIYWWAALSFCVLGGLTLVIAAVLDSAGGAIALGVIGGVWLLFAVGALWSAKRLAWTVEVGQTSIRYQGPRLRLQVPPEDLVEVRPARFDLAGRGALVAVSKQNGVIRLPPSRDVTEFFRALRQVNPAVRLPDRLDV